MKLNRRHKAGFFITIVCVGLSLLDGENLSIALGFFFLGMAASWLIGSVSLRFCYVLLIVASVATVVGAFVLLFSIPPTALTMPTRYALIVILPFCTSFLAFERRVWLRWNGKRLGLVRVPHEFLTTGRVVVTQEMLAAREQNESYMAECLAQVTGIFNRAAAYPDRLSFNQAVNSRAEFAKFISAYSEPLPESIVGVINEVYVAFTNDMNDVARRAGMAKEFEKAEATNYNWHQSLQGKTAEEIYEPLVNPISRPRVLALMRKYEHLGANTNALVQEGLQYNRICEGIESYFSLSRWVGGASGLAVGWWLEGAAGALIGGLVGQLGYPRLMRTLTVIRFLYRGRGLPAQQGAAFKN